MISNLRTEVYPLVDPPVEPEHRAPGARTTASAPRASRRATYTPRRRSAPYPSQDPGSVVPRAPSEHSAPEEEDQQSPEEVEEVEVEVEPEDAQSSEEAPLAPPEGEDCETEGAAVTAPQPILPATPKTPSVLRGSIESFLEPEATSADRSRSRARAIPPAAPSSTNKQLKPVAKTVSSAKVSGHYGEYTYSDGSKERVFVPDIPVEKAPPSSIGPPPDRPVSAPGLQPSTPRRTSSVPAPKPPKPAPPGLGTPEERARLAVQPGKKPLLRKAPPIHSPPSVPTAPPRPRNPAFTPAQVEALSQAEQDRKRQQQLAAQRTRLYAPSPPATGRVIPPRPDRPAPAPRERTHPWREQGGAASSAPGSPVALDIQPTTPPT